MNIPVLTYSGKAVFRPDTSREWKNGDFYLSDKVTSLLWSPVLSIGISRAGKCVGEKFASRYFDGLGIGMLLYPADLLDGSPEGFAAASCMDHTTYITPPELSAESLGQGSPFIIEKDGNRLAEIALPDEETVLRAIAAITENILVRRGDIAALELAPLQPLYNRTEGNVRIQGSLAGLELIDFEIIVE